MWVKRAVVAGLAMGLLGVGASARADKDDDARARIQFGTQPPVYTQPPQAYPQPYAAPGYGYGYQRRWNDPGAFAQQIREEAARVDGDIRYDVRQGWVSPEALPALNASRQEIEHDLAEATSKGYITRDDRAHLENHIQEMRELRDRFAAGNY